MLLNDWLIKSELVSRAYEFSKIRSVVGFQQSLAIAENIAQWGLDEITIAAALLYKAAENEPQILTEIARTFGAEINLLLEKLFKLNKIRFKHFSDEEQIEDVRKMILAFSGDLRVLFIKLAAQLDLARRTAELSPETQKTAAWENEEVYSSLASRLGMQNVSGELKDLSFAFLRPREYQWLVKNAKEHFRKREIYLKKVKKTIESFLIKEQIKLLTVDSRIKRYSSLHKKLLYCNMDIEQVYDLVALRIFVKNIADCYAVLSLLHKRWSPKRAVRDFIAFPKPNGYRSLHTVIQCLNNKFIEIQIRTPEMHQEAENGIAAHWFYEQEKNNQTFSKGKISSSVRNDLLLTEQLRRWKNFSPDSETFFASLKTNFYRERIFALTPKGDIVRLPVGATAVDFAYHIHSEIGDRAVGVKINNERVNLSAKLCSGDVVEILTQKNKKPSEDWLRFVKTALAKHQIKSALRQKLSIGSA